MTDDTAPGAPAEHADEVVAAEIVTSGGDAPLIHDLPDDPDEAVTVLLEALETARASANAYVDDLKRLAADFENFKKRAARERDEIVERSSQRVLTALLPVLDSFEQALAHEPQTEGEQQLLGGLDGTHRQFMDVLAGEGLAPLASQGEPFDPRHHEAVGGAAGDDLIVDQVLRTGYVLGDRVLRPAMVLVAPADPGEE